MVDYIGYPALEVVSIKTTLSTPSLGTPGDQLVSVSIFSYTFQGSIIRPQFKRLDDHAM